MLFVKHIYLHARFYRSIGLLVVLYILSHYMVGLRMLSQIALLAFLGALLMDIYLLFLAGGSCFGRRSVPERLSNGDDNRIDIYLENRYPFTVNIAVIDELPFQFQNRDFHFEIALARRGERRMTYTLRPTTRGAYHFGALNLYVSSPLRLVQRRFRYDQAVMTPVYPSYIQMRKYELLAISNRLSEAGIKKIRRVGHTMEFEQIREYVRGDDYRTINWKATARRTQLMVNHYQDEKSQQVYSLIDMGRVMKMPFDGMSLLDYAINASLVISSIAMRKQDRAGIVTFSHRVDAVLPADRRPAQMMKIMELLYRQETQFLESDYELLFATLLQKVTRRSLLLLYTNFETLTALRRQLPFLRGLARRHLLVVIFFKNTELRQLATGAPPDVETVYEQTIAEQFTFEKKQIVKELQQYGIYSILTEPQHLSVNTINQYLHLKARGLI